MQAATRRRSSRTATLQRGERGGAAVG